VKSTFYARMEEVSFRSGAAVAGGVLTAAGVAITLAVVLGGHSDAVASAPASRPAAPSVVPATLPPVSSSPSSTPRASRTMPPATVAGAYQPPSAAQAVATPHAAATPTPAGTPTPRRLEPRGPQPPGTPDWWGRDSSPPPFPWPWGVLHSGRRRPAGTRHAYTSHTRPRAGHCER
jgi:hypothetical protein